MIPSSWIRQQSQRLICSAALFPKSQPQGQNQHSRPVSYAATHYSVSVSENAHDFFIFQLVRQVGGGQFGRQNVKSGKWQSIFYSLQFVFIDGLDSGNWVLPSRLVETEISEKPIDCYEN